MINIVKYELTNQNFGYKLNEIIDKGLDDNEFHYIVMFRTLLEATVILIFHLYLYLYSVSLLSTGNDCHARLPKDSQESLSFEWQTSC